MEVFHQLVASEKYVAKLEKLLIDIKSYKEAKENEIEKLRKDLMNDSEDEDFLNNFDIYMKKILSKYGIPLKKSAIAEGRGLILRELKNKFYHEKGDNYYLTYLFECLLIDIEHNTKGGYY